MATSYGRWKVEGKTIGGGGQGQVELVTDALGLEKGKFALKTLKDDRRRDRFQREITAVVGLAHPNIVRIVDYSIKSPPYFYVMEYCEPGSLEKIGGSTFKGEIARCLAILEPVCDALAAAHERGIVHRDVKPANILMRTDGTPVVADFGICHVDGDEFVTLHEEAMGARNYTAPEMEAGRRYLGEPSEKTDVYALGKVLYWMLSGGSIFGREDHRATPLTKVLADQRWEHVHMLIDNMVVEKPSDRCDLQRVRRELPRLRELIEGNFASLKPSIGIKCRFCGVGTYRRGGELLAGTVAVLRSTELGAAGQVVSVNVMSCDACGHVELFNVQKARSWWEQ